MAMGMGFPVPMRIPREWE